VQVNPELSRELSKLRTKITMIAVMVLFAPVEFRLSATETERLSTDNQPSQHSPMGSDDLMAY